MNLKKINILFILLVILNIDAQSQGQKNILIDKMEEYEVDIQNTYNEYQKVYYERKSSKNELIAFEEIISIYVSQILEIYETLSLSSINEPEKPRDIAARSLIFRALTYLEKAPLNIEFYEEACYDYYTALDIYNGSDELPVIIKPLPNAIKVANKEYYRLIDLIEEKGKDLYSFGKINISLKNFKITSNLNADSFQFIRFDSNMNNEKYTYNRAENLIKQGFNKTLLRKQKSDFFLALPEGSYFIKSTAIRNALYPYLAAIYVRANQQQNYVIEPLVDWIVMYENPQSKQLNILKSENSVDYNSKQGNGNGNGKVKSNLKLKDIKDLKNSTIILNLINEKVTSCMESIDITKIFNLRDPWIRSRFSNSASKIISTYILSDQFHNCWSLWMLSWEISKKITEDFSPGNPVPTELVQLVYNVLKSY